MEAVWFLKVPEQAICTAGFVENLSFPVVSSNLEHVLNKRLFQDIHLDT